MNTLKGTVTAARATTAMSGGGNDSQVQTTHILLFKVDGRQAKISSASPAMINDNDSVILVGTEKNGAFDVLAYRNETTGVVGDVGKLRSIIGMIVGFCGAVFVSLGFNASAFGYVPKLIGLVFLIVGLFCVARFIKINSAANQLARWPRESTDHRR